MKQIKNKERKFIYLANKYKWTCPIALSYGQYEPLTIGELHHKLHNTQVNYKLYPHFLHSIWNLVPVNHNWHMKYPTWGKVSFREAEKREAFLVRHPAIEAFMNMRKR